MIGYDKDRATKIADRLNALMKEHDVTDSELASKVGISESSVRAYKGMRNGMSIRVAEKISNFYGIDAEYILGISDIKNKNTNKEGYIDTVAHEVVNTNPMHDIKRGEIYEYILSNGQTKFALILSDPNSRFDDKTVAMIVLNPNTGIEIRCGGIMYADPCKLSYGNVSRISRFARKTTDDEMKAIDDAILEGTGIKLGWYENSEEINLLRNEHERLKESYKDVCEETEFQRNLINELEQKIESLKDELSKKDDEHFASYNGTDIQTIIKIASLEAENRLYKQMFEMAQVHR